MNVSSISDLARQHMLNILGYSSNAQTGTSSGNLSIGPSTSSTLSPFAQMLTQLQQMEQSNPGQYTQVSQQISTNLAAAASTAQGRGNAKLATQLTTLSKDFSSAAQSGQLPNVADLEKAMQAAKQSGNGTVTTASGSHSGQVTLGQILSLAGI